MIFLYVVKFVIPLVMASSVNCIIANNQLFIEIKKNGENINGLQKNENEKKNVCKTACLLNTQMIIRSTNASGHNIDRFSLSIHNRNNKLRWFF